jgi:hypothetical protein
MSAVDPEMEALKTRLKGMWMAGDFGQVALREDLARLWSEHNRATDGTTHVDGEYLEVLARRA